MEAPRSAGGRRTLLPFEIQLIDQLGITVEEYWQFNDAALERIQQKEQGYELVPEIYNEPTTVIAVASLVIGLASTAVGLLMKPKAPRAQSNDVERRNLETGDNIGRSRFNPRYGFDSVQTLATLGKPIPLIFTRRGKFAWDAGGSNNRRNCGGTRVSSQLIFSMLKSGPNNQELRIAALLGLGGMEWIPEYEGFAIGSTKLEDYPEHKVFICYNPNGGTPRTNSNRTEVYREGKLYDTPPLNPLDVNLISTSGSGQPITRAADSGTNSPTTGTQFGCYNFCPSGTGFRLPLAAVTIPFNDFSTEEGRKAVRMEEIKFNFYLYPRGCGFTKLERNGSNITPGFNKSVDYIVASVKKGDIISYKIGAQFLPGRSEDDASMFDLLQTEDINQITDQSRAQTDDILNIGEVYSISNFIAKCIGRDAPNEDPYDGRNNRINITYRFEALENGYIKFSDQFREGRLDESGSTYEKRKEAIINGSAHDGLVDNRTKIRNNREYGNVYPAETSYVAEISDGIVSMSRPTTFVEFGIKSQVWRRISGPNTASYPSNDQLDKVRETNGQFTLGQMDRYLKRYSFFRLMYRKGGYGNSNKEVVGNPWQLVLAQNLVFCVEGRSPQDMYNYIKIRISSADNATENQLYDFKFEPVPGAVMDWKIATNNDQIPVAMFSWDRNSQYSFSNDQLSNTPKSENWEVAFNGVVKTLTAGALDIVDTQKGPINNARGRVTDLSRYENNLPKIDQWGKPEVRYKDPSKGNTTREKVTRRDIGNGRYRWEFWWNNTKINTQENTIANKNKVTYTQGNYRYSAGGVNTEGNQWPDLKRYEIVREEKIPFTPNVIQTGKQQDSTNGSGRGLTLKIISYQDPDVIGDETGYYARWEIENPGSGYKSGDTVKFTIRRNTEILTVSASDKVGGELYRRAAACDYPLYENETISCDTSPEHELVYVNQITPYDDGNGPNYKDLSYLTLHLQAGREFTSFSDFSGYIKRGLEVTRLVTDNVVSNNYTPADYREQFQTENFPTRLPERYATNLLPEIATALLADPQIGVGEIVGGYQVHYNNMRTAANYCLANGFTWDGIIAERVNLREWIYQNAVYNLLDFVVEGGRFSLVPALLYSPSSYKIDPLAKPPIAALFTDGNMKGYKASYLQPEDRQLFTAVVLYRREIGNGFPVTDSVTVNLVSRLGGKPDIDPVEEFDLSDSVTSIAHAEAFAKFALRVRQSVTHTIEFSTTVNEILGVEPGSYIKVTTESHYHPESNKTAQRFKNGSVGPEGQVTSNEDLHNKTVDVYYWQSGNNVGVLQGSMTIDKNGYTQQAAFFSSVFTVIEANVTSRVYRINSIAYGEEGFVDVSATHVPLTAAGSLQVADWNDEDFIVDFNA